MGNYFKNVRNWRSFGQKNNTPNEISSGFNAVDMFSMYVWHAHNVKTLLKLVLGILGRQFRTLFEIIALMPFFTCVDLVLLKAIYFTHQWGQHLCYNNQR